jgi:hypothetical protein
LDPPPRLQHAFMPSNVGPNSSRPNQKKTLDSDHGIYRDPGAIASAFVWFVGYPMKIIR